MSKLRPTVQGHVFCMAKDGVIARQFLLGVAQTAEGVPLYHEVFDGNVAETRTLLPTLGTVLVRFPSVRRLILVADRGPPSLDNLGALREIRRANGNPLEFILAVPGRRYNEFLKELRALLKTECHDTQAGGSPNRPGTTSAWSWRTTRPRPPSRPAGATNAPQR